MKECTIHNPYTCLTQVESGSVLKRETMQFDLLAQIIMSLLASLVSHAFRAVTFLPGLLMDLRGTCLFLRHCTDLFHLSDCPLQTIS